MKFPSQAYRRISSFLGSSTFFWLIVILFVLQAAWIAVTARYPQAFDEQFHFGVIQIYSHQLSPFLATQPPNSGQYGPLVFDPSYLYYYTMSFPYRLISAITNSQEAQIIFLRLINVGLLAGALLVFRKVLRLLPLPNTYINMSLLFFVVLPVVPLLGGQINYDNMLIPLSGLATLWTVRLVQHVHTKRQIHWGWLARLLILCFFASLVKYAFLAVFTGVILALFWSVAGSLRTKNVSFKQLFNVNLGGLKRTQSIVLCFLLVVSFAMFFQRYAENFIRFHEVMPRCQEVLSRDECSKNGPWARSQLNQSTRPPLRLQDKLEYPLNWTEQNIKELTFTISSAFADDGIMVDYYARDPLPVVYYLVWVLYVVGFALAAAFSARLWQNPVARSFIIIVVVYTAVLFVKNYGSFETERQVVAVHGRYLFPIIFLAYGVGMLALKWLLELRPLKHRARSIKLCLLVVAVILLLEGGLTTYLIRSDSSWFWPQNTAAQELNEATRDVISPLVLGG